MSTIPARSSKPVWILFLNRIFDGTGGSYQLSANLKTILSFAICPLLILIVAEPSTAQKPELVVQTGHSLPIDSLAFSPDGKKFASGSWDQTIKLWDVNAGTELRTFKGHSNWVLSVGFSADGKTLASGSADMTIMLWDVASGRVLRTLEGHSDRVDSVAFSPDEKTLASGSWDHMIKLWDVSSGKELRTLKGHSDHVNSVAFSPDGKTLASSGDDATIRLWDVSSGTQLRTLKGHSDLVLSLAFSPDGKTLASGSDDATIDLWDINSGKELRTLKGNSISATLAFSPGGKTLASSGNDTIKLWDASTGTELRTLKGHSYLVFSVAFSPDGKTLVSGSDDAIKLWDVSGGTELRTLKGHSNWIFSVALSADGKALASGSYDTIKLWDVSGGTELRTLKGHFAQVLSVAFSPDGQVLSSGSDYATIELWDVNTGKELRTLKGHSDGVGSMAFSPDGKTLASGSRDRTIKLWNVASGKELRTLKGHADGIGSVAFSPDGKTLATGGRDRAIKLWDVASGTELRALEGHFAGIRSVAFTRDGKTLASGSDDATIKLWDVASGTELRALKGHFAQVPSVAFSPDGKTLASGSNDQTIKLWDVTNGTELRTIKGHSNWVLSVAFSPDGKTLASGSVDKFLKLWRVVDGTGLASLVTLDENAWVVVTPEGLFDGSPAAWNKIIWLFNNNSFNHAPVEAFFNEFYYPGLLADIFAGKRPKAASDISLKDRRQPQLNVTAAVNGGNPTVREGARNVSVKIDLSESPADKDHKTGSGAQDVRLFRNGLLVKVWRGDVLKGKSSVALEATVPIVAGENKLTAYAFNHDNVKSSDAEVVVTGAESLKRPGTAYVLSIGVNVYSNKQYNLKYAVPDARDFAAEIKRQQEALKRYAKVEIIPLLNAQATKANITQRLAQLKEQVQPEDAVIVFFAGHGTAHGNQFYLIPHDLGYRGPRENLSAAGLKTILAHSISDRELEKLFEGIDAGQLLLVIDACNSGQALEAEEKRRGPMNSKGLAQLAYEKGMYVMTAAQSYQAALEASKYGHGYLTYALVEEGLKKGSADREPKNGSIDIREWLNFATDEVPRMQEQSSRDALRGRGKRIIFVGDGRKVGIPKTEVDARDNIQRPRVFYRRELQANPLVVGAVASSSPR